MSVVPSWVLPYLLVAGSINAVIGVRLPLGEEFLALLGEQAGD